MIPHNQPCVDSHRDMLGTSSDHQVGTFFTGGLCPREVPPPPPVRAFCATTTSPPSGVVSFSPEEGKIYSLVVNETQLDQPRSYTVQLALRKVSKCLPHLSICSMHSNQSSVVYLTGNFGRRDHLSHPEAKTTNITWDSSDPS